MSVNETSTTPHKNKTGPEMAGSALLRAKPQQDFVNELAEADRRSRSWREKLQAIQSLLAGNKGAELGLQQLVDLAVYARFLATGEIPCTEDGRHFRPVHHSRLAQEIEEQLGSLTGPESVFVIRKILPCLPSTAQPARLPY